MKEDQLMEERLRKLREVEGAGVNPYPYKYERTAHAREVNEKFKKLKKEEKTRTQVKVAGRIIQMRRMGKATFMHIKDFSGKVQLYFRFDDLSNYKFLKELDLGDIIGAEGTVFKTKTGEVTVYVKNYTMLAKALRPLPEKFHGLKDTETRYRQRYLDLIMNDDVKKIFITRSKIMAAIREFLDKRDFIEAEIPVLQPIYGGAKAKPFKTHHHSLNTDLYLSISPELYLKRLIIGGFEKVYEISKNFRNEGIDTTHNPEFTMIELYKAYADYNDMMKITEDIYNYVAKKVIGKTMIEYQGNKIDFKKPWKKLSMADAIKKYAGFDVRKLDDKELADLATTYNLKIEGDLTSGKIIEELFEELVVNKLIQPVFITDHPRESTPLCKLNRTDARFVERFEPFVAGFEIGNAYSELNDPILQKKLLEAQAKEIMGHPVDKDFIKALEYGMPPTGGLGLGIDRMVMLLTNQSCIRDVILFPTLKPLYGGTP